MSALPTRDASRSVRAATRRSVASGRFEKPERLHRDRLRLDADLAPGGRGEGGDVGVDGGADAAGEAVGLLDVPVVLRRVPLRDQGVDAEELLLHVAARGARQDRARGRAAFGAVRGAVRARGLPVRARPCGLGPRLARGRRREDEERGGEAGGRTAHGQRRISRRAPLDRPRRPLLPGNCRGGGIDEALEDGPHGARDADRSAREVRRRERRVPGRDEGPVGGPMDLVLEPDPHAAELGQARADTQLVVVARRAGGTAGPASTTTSSVPASSSAR